MTYQLRADDVSHHRAEAIDDNSVSTWGDRQCCVRKRTNPEMDGTRNSRPYLFDARALVDLMANFKGALYRIWCGVNRLGDSGVKVV